MLTTTDAAKLLGVSRARVITLIHLGTLVATKPGRDWQIDEASVEAYKKSPRRAGRKPQNKPQAAPHKKKESGDTAL